MWMRREGTKSSPTVIRVWGHGCSQQICEKKWEDTETSVHQSQAWDKIQTPPFLKKIYIRAIA